jgi:hypothetical protein
MNRNNSLSGLALTDRNLVFRGWESGSTSDAFFSNCALAPEFCKSRVGPRNSVGMFPMTWCKIAQFLLYWSFLQRIQLL